MQRKAIFISGGGSGIGRAMAQHFAARGWFVGLGDISEDGMAQTVALLPERASSSHLLDVRDPAQWQSALAAFAAQTGERLDVLANNAGVGHAGAITELSERQIAQLVEVNVLGVIHGARAAHPFLAATPGSCLLNMASASAFYGVGGMSVYSATKFAVRALTEALDAEWHADGIRVRSLMPSFIDTPLLAEPANQHSNRSKREAALASGMEVAPASMVAEAAWNAVHGRHLHNPVGRTARMAAFFARWAPAIVRRRARQLMAERLAGSDS